MMDCRKIISALLAAWAAVSPVHGADAAGLLTIDNGCVRVGIDRARGGAIAWLSWRQHPGNAINLADPGRLIQQSYYAGKAIDRIVEGQGRSWSPWPWNPIQGGGLGSWARVTRFECIEQRELISVTVPKLWDMPDEEAAGLMRQWTSFEPGLSNAIRVRCVFSASRAEVDRWGSAVERSQEIPACYFTRSFGTIKSYLGDSQWREETQPPGPPWGRANPPRKAMAVFDASGQGVAVFSPAATESWNFGPHGSGDTDEPEAKPCVHVAPLDRARLGASAEYAFRYWLVAGSESEISSALEILWHRHADEKAVLREGSGPDRPDLKQHLSVFNDSIAGWVGVLNAFPEGIVADVGLAVEFALEVPLAWLSSRRERVELLVAAVGRDGALVFGKGRKGHKGRKGRLFVLGVLFAPLCASSGMKS